MSDNTDTDSRSVERSWVSRFVMANRAVHWHADGFHRDDGAVFLGNPRVFSDYRIYYSVLTTLPVAIFVVVPLVFIVTVGEIDLSFPAVMAFGAWIFALGVQAGYRPFPVLCGGNGRWSCHWCRDRGCGGLWWSVVAGGNLGPQLPDPRCHPDRDWRQIDCRGLAAKTRPLTRFFPARLPVSRFR